MRTRSPGELMGSRSAPLEYWFWKFSTGDLAFLVDFIVRRERSEGEIRVSLWVRGTGRVARLTSVTWSAGDSGVSIDGSRMDVEGSQGVVEDVAWDLAWRPGPHRVRSRPAFFGPLHPLDLELLLAPDARFTGSVIVGGEAFAVGDVPGLLTHYWGRRLPDRWCWISATEFPDDPDRRVEALVGRSALWGQRRIQMPVGYVWTADRHGPEFTLSPVSGLTRLQRAGNAVDITSLRIDGRRHRITCRADDSAFNDLGEGIRQTLLADLTFDGQQAVPGTTGLEFRG